MHIANPTQRFSHPHVDLVGPLPTSTGGHTHLLTVLDRLTQWAEAIPLRSTSAESCATALIGGWVESFRVPEQITSDCGRQFCSSLWDALTHHLGVKMRFTTSYHPQSNGAVPPPPEGLLTGAASGRGLAQSPALGVAQAPSCPS
jgi:hypothetical protein